ncbi:hypothetical protein F4861DRAFT_518213 [Xylaria intraflava]|nr:hypothetical protein F4861DRAFT_518213 [Xylaria intraflava]
MKGTPECFLQWVFNGMLPRPLPLPLPLPLSLSRSLPSLLPPARVVVGQRKCGCRFTNARFASEQGRCWYWGCDAVADWGGNSTGIGPHHAPRHHQQPDSAIWRVRRITYAQMKRLPRLMSHPRRPFSRQAICSACREGSARILGELTQPTRTKRTALRRETWWVSRAPRFSLSREVPWGIRLLPADVSIRARLRQYVHQQRFPVRECTWSVHIRWPIM